MCVYPGRITRNNLPALQREFFVNCSGHFETLNKYPVQCCCGRNVETDYYRFTLTRRDNPDAATLFLFAGPRCGMNINEFFNLTPPPRIIFWLADGHGPGHGPNRHGPNNIDPVMPRFNGINAEIFVVASFLQILRRETPINALENLISRLRNNPNRVVSDRELQFLGRLATDETNRLGYASLREAMTALFARPGRNVRAFEFLLLRGKLAELGVANII